MKPIPIPDLTKEQMEVFEKEIKKPLKKKGKHALPIFCMNCYHHSYKNCYGENPCTPVRLMRLFPNYKMGLAIQEVYFKIPFEEREKWNKKTVTKEKTVTKDSDFNTIMDKVARRMFKTETA